MNEILMRKHTKRVMSYGIPKTVALEIVETAFEVSSNNIEMAINYAIDLQYGLGFTQRNRAK
jgi:hypothetical protein